MSDRSDRGRDGDVVAGVDVGKGTAVGGGLSLVDCYRGVVGCDCRSVVHSVDGDVHVGRVGLAEGVFDLVDEAHRVRLAHGQRFECSGRIIAERAVRVVRQHAGGRVGQVDRQSRDDIVLLVGVVGQSIEVEGRILVGRHIVVVGHRRRIEDHGYLERVGVATAVVVVERHDHVVDAVGHVGVVQVERFADLVDDQWLAAVAPIDRATPDVGSRIGEFDA